ncbi:MAG: succinylglutamate desuccinylase/aspartoacylase family protein, partial [Desulfuromonadales bacterium]|nr:succinylglutamate desuccinylase/aspartoacylase family protein [Desulfuromonadales bacterium]
ILILGGIHGDEYSSVSIVFKWMEILDRQHPGLYHWKVVPLLNPDGLLRPAPRRGNARNVDLNRNFSPLGDPGASLRYWQEHTRRDPRRYPGPMPLSEPETVFVTHLIDEFRPDLIIAVHAPYGIIDFDGQITAPQRLGRLHLHLLGTFPGSLGNYAALQLRIPVVTIELPSAGRLPSPQEISAIWHDLGTWLAKNLPDRTSLHYYSRLRP